MHVNALIIGSQRLVGQMPGRTGGHVGFSGSFIVVRADRPLTDLPALRPLEGEASWHWQGPGGWQAAQIDRGPAGWHSRDLASAYFWS